MKTLKIIFILLIALLLFSCEKEKGAHYDFTKQEADLLFNLYHVGDTLKYIDADNIIYALPIDTFVLTQLANATS